jgi:hypothetical protein
MTYVIGEVEVTNEVSLAPSAVLYDGAVVADSDLTVLVNGFYYDLGGTKGKYAGSTCNSVTDDATNYVFLDSGAALGINTTGYPSGILNIRLARVVAAGGVIVRIILERPFFTAAALTGFDNPMTTRGDIIFGGASPAGTPERLGATEGGFLRSGGTGADPTFSRTIDANSVLASATVGASPAPCAILEADSTTKGFLPPRMTKVQRDAITNLSAGLEVYLPVERRISYYDGIVWRIVAVTGLHTITVGTDGTGDFDTITAALASITDAAVDNRYQILVAPGTYSEGITMIDFVTLTGVGWDTVIAGTLDLTGVSENTLSDFRVESTNAPALIFAGGVGGSGTDILGCFLNSTWDATVDPGVVRCCAQVTSGLLYLYMESEFALTVNDTVNVASTTKQTCVYISGSGDPWMEMYGCYNYLTTDNPGNGISMIYSIATGTEINVLSETGGFRLDLIGVAHANKAHLANNDGGNGLIDVNSTRVQIAVTSPNTAQLHSSCCNSAPISARVRSGRNTFIKDGIADANIYLGASTTANDTLEVIDNLFYMDFDVLPGRYTALGVDGVLQYSVRNNFGSVWNIGSINGVRNYPTDTVDPTDPVPVDGDRYYNTVLHANLTYDGSRSKWVTTTSSRVEGGRNGNTAAGSFYRGVDGITFGANIGVPVNAGTVTGLSWTRTDSDLATLEVLVDSTVVCELASAAAGVVVDNTLNADFAAGLMKFRNKVGGNTTTSVQAVCTYRGRVP